MPDWRARRQSARRTLFSGGLDVEGMDDVLALYCDLYNLNENSPLLKRDQRELTEEEARMRLAEGFTLIDPEEILPGAQGVADRVRDVVQILSRHSDDPDVLMEDLANLTVEPGRLCESVRTFLSKGEDALRKSLALIDDVNPEVVMFVLFNALKSFFLEAAARCVQIDKSAWEKGYCPVCGGEPAVSYLIGEGGKRYLVCFRCETHWRYRRLACPYCGHENPKGSVYLYSEDADYRTLSASVCSECRSYIKVWRAEGDELGDMHPEVEDLKTPGFDRSVENEGYLRGAPNIYGLWIGTPADEVEDND